METLGIVIIVGVVTTWLAGLWLGWTLLFSSSMRAVIEIGSGRPATFWERVYYAGDSLFGLSPQGLSVGPEGWRFLSTFAALSGLILVTLSISYFVPVLSAATERRRCAAYISTYGLTPQQIVLETWGGLGLQELHDYLNNIIPMLADLTERHLAYPVLYSLHSADRRTALTPSIAALDEALTIVEFGLNHEGPLPHSVTATRRAIARFFETLQQFPEEEAEVPPAPSLKPLIREGIPTVKEKTFAADVERLEDHRRLLLAIVREDGWTWEETVEESPDPARRTGVNLRRS